MVQKVNDVKIFNIATNPCGIGGTETFSRVLNKCFTNSQTYCFNTLKKYYFNVPFTLLKTFWYIKFIPKFLHQFITPSLVYSFPNMTKSIIVINAPVDLERIPIKYLKNSKVIYLAHSSPQHVWTNKNYFGKNRKNRLNRLNFVDKIVTLSSEYIPELSKLLSTSLEKFTSVTHTVELIPVVKPKKLQKNIITICRFHNESKRLDRFIEIAKELPDYSFKIYGFGEDEEFIKSLAKPVKNVSMMGTTTDIENVHENAGIFLMTSDFEGLSIAVLEAISQATPVVITKNCFGMAKEIIKNGENGFVNDEFSIKESIEKIRIIENNYSYYSQNAINSFSNFGVESFKKQWKKMFSELDTSTL